MQITLTNTGKRYNREWIFRHCDYTFIPGHTYAITGPNGSGKSTLLQVIAGAILQSEGKVEFADPAAGNGNEHPAPYLQVSIAAPYLELIEEMTATELLGFHAIFKSLSQPIPAILEETGLHNAAHKQLRYFSSGMKQRLKLAQAFFSNSSVLLLDEPTTNLDSDGCELYHKLVRHFSKDKLVIVSSNDPQEYSFCNEIISITDYK